MDLNYIILAAGQGTRMKADKPKILHKIAGVTLIEHCLTTAAKSKPAHVALVLAEENRDHSEMRRIVEEVQKNTPLTLCYQKTRNGTAHAVTAALPAIKRFKKDSAVIILYGDTPLIQKRTVQKIYRTLQQKNDMVVLGFYADNITGYGRILMQNGDPIAIREEINASPKEKSIKLCNSGIFGFKQETLVTLLPTITKNPVSGEYYLTDMLEKSVRNNKKIALLLAQEEEIIGVNTPAQLSLCEGIMQKILRRNALQKGVIMPDPDSVFLSADTQIGAQTHIDPFVVIAPKCRIGKHVTIKSFTHMEGVRIRDHAVIGPHARLRPETDIGNGARIGNFVEVKKSRVKDGAKVNHLSYVGDSDIGHHANIGAGVITCNYDGTRKHQTKIGSHAFIGSNVALVAPVKIDDNTMIGAGTTIRKNIGKNTLAVAKQNIIIKERK